MKRIFKPLAVSAMLVFLGWLTAFFVTENAVNGWYQSINKSTLNPPDWIFGPMWTLLYALLGMAAYRLWQHRGTAMGKRALVFFAVQLAANYAWSFVFFGMAAFPAAFMLLLFIDLFTLLAMLAAWPVDRKAVALMAPYLAWISFATYLTYAVMVLN